MCEVWCTAFVAPAGGRQRPHAWRGGARCVVIPELSWLVLEFRRAVSGVRRAAREHAPAVLAPRLLALQTSAKWSRRSVKPCMQRGAMPRAPAAAAAATAAAAPPLPPNPLRLPACSIKQPVTAARLQQCGQKPLSKAVGGLLLGTAAAVGNRWRQ